MVIAIVTTDNRENFRQYSKDEPWFGTSPQALLEGFEALPDVTVHVISCAQQAMRSPRNLGRNILFHSVHVPKSGWLRTGYQGCIRAVRKKLREISPDIVHGQGTERECAISATFSGYPNVVTIHGNMAEIARIFPPRPFSYLWLAARLETLTLPRTAGVFCNSGYTQSLVVPRAKRVWRVANPVRTQFFEAQPEPMPRQCILTNIGVVTPRKRQLELLDLVQRLRSRGLQFRFDFVGACDGSPYSQEFMRRAASLQDCVRHVGFLGIQELIAQIDSSAALIHFPVEEAFGLVVCEGLARGLKLFGARTGGIPDIAAGLPGAELFEVDDWAGLEQSIAAWIEKGFPMPAGAVQVMRERYHPSVIAQRHVEIYREVLARPS